MFRPRLSLLLLMTAAPLGCDKGSHCDCMGGGDDGRTIEPLCGAPERLNANQGPDQVTAALTAMRDGQATSVSFLNSADGGYSGTAGYAYAPGDGTVFFDSLHVIDSYEFGLPIDHFELKDAAFFDACLADADMNARFLCLFDVAGEKIGTCDGSTE